MNLEEWKEHLTTLHPGVKFLVENGRGSGYGCKGDWTAMVGPSPLTDVVGVFTTKGLSSCAHGHLRVQLPRC
jgi:hypothetical protein